MTTDPEDDVVTELVTFRSQAGSYVYAPLPSATSYGHRAELWNVDHWLKEVRTKLVAVGDNMYVRLEEIETGELFAECPLPVDGTPLTTVVEPVVDSSRYFVLRIVDRETNNHAFIGLGFRERSESSDFTAALDEYRLYLRRKKEALLMRQAYEQQQQQQQQQQGEPSSSGAETHAVTSPSGVSTNLSLQGSITLNIQPLKLRSSGGGDAPGLLTRTPSLPLSADGTGGTLRLQPPPSSSCKTGSTGSKGAGSTGGMGVGSTGGTGAGNTGGMGVWVVGGAGGSIARGAISEGSVSGAAGGVMAEQQAAGAAAESRAAAKRGAEKASWLVAHTAHAGVGIGVNQRQTVSDEFTRRLSLTRAMPGADAASGGIANSATAAGGSGHAARVQAPIDDAWGDFVG